MALRERGSGVTLPGAILRQAIDRAKYEAGVRLQMSHVPYLWLQTVDEQRAYDRTVRYYRRYFAKRGQ